MQTSRYNIEVLLRGEWTPTDDRDCDRVEARAALNAWNALGYSARMVAAQVAA